MASTRPPGTYSPSARTGRRGGDSGGVAGLVRRAGCDALPSVDGSNPAISGHRKSGHFRRPETGVEFYLTAPCVGKVVWTLVRQLRGPHFSSITPASRTRAGRVRPRCPRLGRITGLRCAP